MNIRQAKKIRDKHLAGVCIYKGDTLERMRNRLFRHFIPDDHALFFSRLMDEFNREDPIGLAQLQFQMSVDLQIEREAWCAARDGSNAVRDVGEESQSDAVS